MTKVKEKVEKVVQFKQVGYKFVKGIDSFILDDKALLSANIRQFGVSFNRHLWGHSEKGVQAVGLVANLLRENCENRVMNGFIKEIKLFHLVSLVRLQSKGEDEGLLLVNGRNNVAKVKNAKKESVIVIARWMGCGNLKKYWSMDAFLEEEITRYQLGINILSYSRWTM